MTYTYEGKTYKIEFSRAKEMVKTYEKGVEVWALSRHPFTSTQIRELDPNYATNKKFTIIATAKAGCSPEDQFTLEGGRLRALKKVTPMVPEGMRKVMWEAYHGRAMGTPTKKVTPSSSTPVLPGYPQQAKSFGFDLETPVNGWMM